MTAGPPPELRALEVRGSGGVRLHVREAGPLSAPPILLIHGWSQSWMSWHRQMQSELSRRFRLVAFDLRGHGMSDVPREDEAYTDASRWASDVKRLIGALRLERPLLVGWSFGGYVICDYLRAYGQAEVSGLNLVSWAVMIGDTPKERALTGSGFNDHFEGATSDDLPTSIAAMRAFVDECHVRKIPAEDREVMLLFNMIVPPFVRRATATRGTLDNSKLLSELSVPVLITQGDADTITKRAAAAHILRCCPTARESIYSGIGHMPFLEDPERFNRELSEFALMVHGQ